MQIVTIQNLWEKGRNFLKLNPSTLPVVAAQELVLFAGRVFFQYEYASKQLPQEAIRYPFRFTFFFLHSTLKESYQKRLREELQYLVKHGIRVRVVAHSLGCKLLVSALSGLDVKERPHEIHLCAPAFEESEFASVLENMSQERTYLYYTMNDWILATYSLFHGDDAIGYIGPKQKYSGLYSKDVETYFPTFVHFSYKNHFHSFAQALHQPEKLD